MYDIDPDFLEHRKSENYSLIRATDIAAITTPQGQAMLPIVSKHTVDNPRIFVGNVYMPAYGIANAHLHRKSTVYLSVQHGAAITLLGHGLETTILHTVGEWLVIPAGIPHVGINTRNTQLTAIEIRDTPGLEDVTLLPELDPIAQQRWQAIRDELNLGEEQ